MVNDKECTFWNNCLENYIAFLILIFNRHFPYIFKYKVILWLVLNFGNIVTSYITVCKIMNELQLFFPLNFKTIFTMLYCEIVFWFTKRLFLHIANYKWVAPDVYVKSNNDYHTVMKSSTWTLLKCWLIYVLLLGCYLTAASFILPRLIPWY